MIPSRVGESKAESIVHFDVTLIPGMLQTGEYTRAVMTECGNVPKDAIEDGMITRMQRHSVLLRPDPPTLVAVIDELALHRIVGGEWCPMTDKRPRHEVAGAGP